MHLTGIKAEHVPFRGAAQTIPAMLSGDVQIAVDNLASYVPVIQEGRIRALAVTSAERFPALPEVPTMAEARMADFVFTSWSLWALPAGTPEPIVRALAGHIRAISEDPEAQRRALAMGGWLRGDGPEATVARLRSVFTVINWASRMRAALKRWGCSSRRVACSKRKVNSSRRMPSIWSLISPSVSLRASAMSGRAMVRTPR
jgi:tripartite-type tricarboxylate transporter receptor subunit TctC